MVPPLPPVIQPVVAVVARRGNTVLVCRRPGHKRHGSLWEFPGGKVHSPETLAEAAARELEEELGLRLVAAGRLLFSHVDPGSVFDIHFLEAEVAGSPELREHTAARWVTVVELLQLELAPSDRVFAQHFADWGTR